MEEVQLQLDIKTIKNDVGKLCLHYNIDYFVIHQHLERNKKVLFDLF